VAFPISVSVPVGSVKTPDPATSGAVTEIKPLVSPENPIELKIVLLEIYCFS
jgi:hypothetical protein